MRAAALVDTLRAQGWGFAIDGHSFRIRRPRGALTDDLRQALLAEKAAIITLLEAEQARAPMPPRREAIAAVRVWSEVLQEAVWVVAEGVPLEAYLGDGKVYSHQEVRVLIEQGRGVKAWAPLDPETEG